MPDDKLSAALYEFAFVMGTDSAEALGHLTCSEFQTVLNLLVVAGFDAQARVAVVGHAMNDYTTTDKHHRIYKLFRDNGGDEDHREVAKVVRAAKKDLGLL